MQRNLKSTILGGCALAAVGLLDSTTAEAGCHATGFLPPARYQNETIDIAVNLEVEASKPAHCRFGVRPNSKAVNLEEPSIEEPLPLHAKKLEKVDIGHYKYWLKDNFTNGKDSVTIRWNATVDGKPSFTIERYNITISQKLPGTIKQEQPGLLQSGLN